MTTEQAETALRHTTDMTDITPAMLLAQPEILPLLRMAMAPPLARDRLIGLAGVRPGLIHSMEIHGHIPPRMNTVASELEKVCHVLQRLIDTDLFPWLSTGGVPTAAERHRAATIVADRQCGAASDPIIRNAQETRQMTAVQTWLENRGYRYLPSGSGATIHTLHPGTFTFRLNVPVNLSGGVRVITIPIDIAIKPRQAVAGSLPILVEAKSAGDFTNTNKRRKEEVAKITQLRGTYGSGVRFVLFLCGYFDSGYLGYEAAEGIDWVWEHRIDDFVQLVI